jgi:hypothetical protein
MILRDENRKPCLTPNGCPQHKYFEGSVTQSGFHIWKIEVGEDTSSFRPRIRGTIESTSSGSRVTVRMRPHLVILAFSILWTAGVCCFTCASICMLLFGEQKVTGIVLLIGCIALICLNWMVTVGGFWLGARGDRQVLIKMLDDT